MAADFGLQYDVILCEMFMQVGEILISPHTQTLWKKCNYPTYTKVTPRDVDNPVWGRDTYDEPLAEAIPNDTPAEEFHEWYTDEK